MSGTFGNAIANLGLAAVVGNAIVLIGIVLTPGEVDHTRDVYPSALDRWSRWRSCSAAATSSPSNRGHHLLRSCIPIDEGACPRALRHLRTSAVVDRRMVTLSGQTGGIASAAARILLERKNGTDWSNCQIARALDWSRNAVDRCLRGERAMPLDAVYPLSRLLDLDPVRVL